MPKRVNDQLPQLNAKFEAFKEKVFAPEGALQQFFKELIAMAVASVARDEGAKAEYTERARRLGASDDQIAEAVAVAWGQAALKAGASPAEVAEALGVLWAVVCETEIASV